MPPRRTWLRKVPARRLGACTGLLGMLRQAAFLPPVLICRACMAAAGCAARSACLQPVLMQACTPGRLEPAHSVKGGVTLAGGLPALAVVLQKHAAAAEWTAALLQPDAEAVLPVLEAMGAEEASGLGGVGSMGIHFFGHFPGITRNAVGVGAQNAAASSLACGPSCRRAARCNNLAPVPIHAQGLPLPPGLQGADPAAVLALLAQCPLSAVPAAAGPALLQALLRLAPTTQQDRGGAQELYDALLGTLRQLAGRDEGLGAEVADATLQLLLATARSVPVQVGLPKVVGSVHCAFVCLGTLLLALTVSVQEAQGPAVQLQRLRLPAPASLQGLPAALGLPAPEGAAPFRLASVDLATLATSIFSPLSRPAVDPLALALPMHLARQLDWRGLAGVPKLATRALLALVALARAAAAAGAAASAPAAGARSARDDPAKAELKELRPFVEAVLAAGEAAGPGGGEGGAEGGLDEGECYLLCMLEVSERGWVRG